MMAPQSHGDMLHKTRALSRLRSAMAPTASAFTFFGDVCALASRFKHFWYL